MESLPFECDSPVLNEAYMSKPVELFWYSALVIVIWCFITCDTHQYHRLYTIVLNQSILLSWEFYPFIRKFVVSIYYFISSCIVSCFWKEYQIKMQGLQILEGLSQLCLVNISWINKFLLFFTFFPFVSLANLWYSPSLIEKF